MTPGTVLLRELVDIVVDIVVVIFGEAYLTHAEEYSRNDTAVLTRYCPWWRNQS